MTQDDIKPRVFIGSSSEKLPVAKALQRSLGSEVYSTVWYQIFRPADFIIESILEALSDNDFGIFIVTGDDVVKSRGYKSESPRDNVVLELGLFIGRLGRRCSFIVIPKSLESKLRLPTDLLGITYLCYDDGHDNLEAALGPVTTKIMEQINAETGKVRPRIYSCEQFMKIEKSAKREVWILRLAYLLEAASFYEVVGENLKRGVKYKYFLNPQFNYRHELTALIQRLRDDNYIAEQTNLISVEQLGAEDVPVTFVFIDPLSSKARGFAIIERQRGGPEFWVEISKRQVRFFVDNWQKAQSSPARIQTQVNALWTKRDENEPGPEKPKSPLHRAAQSGKAQSYPASVSVKKWQQ
jgi:hypothetical protein